MILQLVGSAQDLKPEESPAGHINGLPEVTIFVHIAAMYFSPFRPTFQLLHCKGWPQADEVEVECRGVWQTLWDFCATCDLALVWSMRPWQLCLRHSATNSFDPSKVRATPLGAPALDFQLFWDPTPAARRNRSWACLADNLADVVVEEEAENEDGEQEEEAPDDIIDGEGSDSSSNSGLSSSSDESTTEDAPCAAVPAADEDMGPRSWAMCPDPHRRGQHWCSRPTARLSRRVVDGRPHVCNEEGAYGVQAIACAAVGGAGLVEIRRTRVRPPRDVRATASPRRAWERAGGHLLSSDGERRCMTSGYEARWARKMGFQTLETSPVVHCIRTQEAWPFMYVFRHFTESCVCCAHFDYL